MRSNDSPRFRFPSTLLSDGVPPGTNIMVNGESGEESRDLALHLTNTEPDRNEGRILLSADVSGQALLERATAVTDSLDRGRIGVVDCSGVDDDRHRFDEHGEPIDDPGDLMAIEMEFSALYEALCERGYDRIRVGVCSVSSLIAHADLQSVSRFVHILTGRIIATGDLGVFVVDGSRNDEITVDTIEQFCDCTIDVRSDESDDIELRTRGFGTESTVWRQFSLDEQNQQRH